VGNITFTGLSGQEKAFRYFVENQGVLGFCGKIKVRLEGMSEKNYIYKVM